VTSANPGRTSWSRARDRKASGEYFGPLLYGGSAYTLTYKSANGPYGTREEVLAKYRAYLLGRPDLLALLPSLRGRRLGCWCLPQPCHAEVIAEVIAELADSQLADLLRRSSVSRLN
jgi:Domain of unknown function (DUF4326)